MKTNLIKQIAVTITLVGMSLGAATPAPAQSPSPCDCAAAQIIRVAGVQNVPEASLYWPSHLTPEAGVPELVEDYSILGQVVMNHPAGHLSGAEQIIRIAGAQYVPEAALYVKGHVHQESGASQMARIAPGTMVPEAALYLGDQMPREMLPGPALASAIRPAN
jgi:hypothetical protein